MRREQNEINKLLFKMAQKMQAYDEPRKVTLEYHRDPKNMSCVPLTSNAKNMGMPESKMRFLPSAIHSLCNGESVALPSHPREVQRLCTGRSTIHRSWK